jgi:hypothetical protein
MRRRSISLDPYLAILVLPLVACSGNGKAELTASLGGTASNGGAVSNGGQATGGAVSNGGQATGGAVSNGGQATGGAVSNGGQATGGAVSNGGQATGGNVTVGGTVAAGGKATTVGGSVATGGSVTATGGAATGGAAAGGSTSCGALLDQINVSSTPLPEGVRAGEQNYRIWGRASLGVAPVFTAPLANCGTLVCYTTGTSTRAARVARFDANDQLVTTYNLGAYECRGIAAEPDGHFATLLWATGTATDCNDATLSGRIYVNRYDNSGTATWTAPTELTNPGSDRNCPTDWGLGESRFEFGGGKYGAYYHVHSYSGHEGDTLKYVDLTGTESTTWTWGCSHSMSNLLRYNTADAKFMPACVTDCFPATTGSNYATDSIGGVYINNANKVLNVDGGCNGDVAGELGGAAMAPSGWKIVFNAHQNAATNGQSSYVKSSMNQDIGFASIASGLKISGTVTWLTSTTAISEADSGIERFKPSCDSAEQYLVGWSEPGTTYAYKMGRLSASGTFVEGPVDVTAKAKWGRRDDPFRPHVNGDVVWAWFDSSGSTTLKLGRVRSGSTAQCAAF